MSLAHETLSQVPLATVSPNIAIVTAVGATAAAVSFKRLTPHWHKTINSGEVGVWLKSGEAILHDGFTEQDVRDAETNDPFHSIQHYKIVDPEDDDRGGWRFVGPWRTLQTVYVSDQPGFLQFEVESSDDPRQKIEITANITWNISRIGNNPVRSLTEVKHVKADKKDADMSENGMQEDRAVHPLQLRVEALSRSGLGRVLSGRRAEFLHKLTYFGESEEQQAEFEAVRSDVQAKTIAICALDLIKYGVVLTKLDIQPPVRVDAEVQAQALRTLAPRDAAVGASTQASEFPEENIATGNVAYLADAEAPRVATSL